AALLSKAGYSADRGFMGRYQKERGERIPFYALHPFYEYDILLYNSDFSPTFANEFDGVQDLLSVKGCLDVRLSQWLTPVFFERKPEQKVVEATSHCFRSLLGIPVKPIGIPN